MKETRRVVSDSVMAQASSVWFWDQVLKSLTKTQLSRKSSVGPSAGDTLPGRSEESEALDQMVWLFITPTGYANAYMWQMGQKWPLGLFYLARTTKFSLSY